MAVRPKIVYHAYQAVLYASAPFVAVGLAARTRHRPLLARFVPEATQFPRQPLWVHACSMGEVNAARPLLEGLSDRWPDVPLVLTVSTTTGFAHAEKLALPGLVVTYLPFDLAHVLRGFIAHMRPRALLILETELWPALVRETERAGVPAVLVSGRLSDQHFAGYRRLSWLFRDTVRRLDMVGVQTALYGERFAALGVPSDRIAVTGNVKYDGAITSVAGVEELRDRLGMASETPVLVFGSTRPGDESLAVGVWRGLRERVADLRLVIAPRHLQRLHDVMACFDEPVARWSELRDTTSSSARAITVVDTMGDLVRFYALATVAVVGGSFLPGVDGHNPFEPAALGVPVVFGPYMANFAEPAEMLLARDGAVQVATSELLSGTLEALLLDAARRRAIATEAQQTVLANRGAIAKTLDLVAQHVAMT